MERKLSKRGENGKIRRGYSLSENILTAIIADDSSIDRDILVGFAKDAGINVLTTVASGDWLIDDCSRYQPDIIIINDHLNGTSGLLAYERILDRDLKPYMILVSDNLTRDLMLDAVRLKCSTFLTKPVNQNEFNEKINAVREARDRDLQIHYSTQGHLIRLKSGYKTVLFNEHNIIAIEKLKGEHRSFVHVEGEGKGFFTTSSLKSIAAQPSKVLMMPNQSSIINLNFVDRVYASASTHGNYIIELTNGLEIELPRRNRKQFDEASAALANSI